MDKFKGMLKPRPTPQQLLRDWQRRLRQECRNIDRQIRGTSPRIRSPFLLSFRGLGLTVEDPINYCFRYSEGGEGRAEGDQGGCQEK